MRLISHRNTAVLIFSLALIVRLAYAVPQNDAIKGDACVYDALAVSLSRGDGYVNYNGGAHSLYPPLYPFFLSVIYKFFGHSYAAVRVVQSIIGAFSCVLIFLIGKKMHSFALGAISGFFSIFYLPFIKSAGRLLSELLFTFFLLLIVFYALKVREDKKFRYCATMGLLSGAAVLTRSVAMFLPFLTIPVFIYSEKRHFRGALKKYMTVLLFFGLSMSPWIMRNYNVYHAFVPTTTEGGFGLYLSYFPPGGIFGLAPRSDPILVEAGKIKDPLLCNKFLIRKTLAFIVNNPKKVLALEFKKILYQWAPFDWEIVEGRWFNLPYLAALPFFILGLFFALKEFIKFYPVLLPIIYIQAMTLIFYGSPRFRLPVDPYIFIISILGVLKLKGRILPAVRK